NYHTIADRDHRALGGMSRGAGWTAHVGFQHPALFGALGMHSPAIFYGDETKVSRWLDAAPPDLMPRIYVDIGMNDSLAPSATWLDAALTKRNIRHDYLLNPGSHTRAYWAEHLPDYLRWYTADW
ncbi:MAG: alpha/beta hydrolase-fold protein, partial [Chloroflexota bacterium]